MTQEERLIQIKQLLKEKHQLSTRKIATHFKVSFDTARRDVIHLTTTGQAVRIHGGLMEINQNSVPDFLARNQIQSPIKLKMTQMAKRFVHPGQCDFIGSSTTLKQLCPLLNGTDVQIVTNSIDNALSMLTSPIPSVRLLGGLINKSQRYIYSEAALETIRKIHFNTAFIGASRVRADGVYAPRMEDAEIVRAAIKHANQIVLVAEKYKFTNDSTSPYMSAPLEKIDVLITDTPLTDKQRQFFDPKTQIIPIMKEWIFMFSLFNLNKSTSSNTKMVYQDLKKFYNSFFSDIYNEMNIGRYRPIRDAIGLVMNKFDSHDHPLEYTSKLVMYIQARVAMNHLHLTCEQENLMKKLTEATKYVNLSYVYLSPLDSEKQFVNI